jgi:hypothetical protein
MKYAVLPESGIHLIRMKPRSLVKQGALLHYATLNSCLRVSKAFRIRHGKSWLKVAVKRFMAEFGTNVALFGALVMLNWLFFPDHFWVANVVALFVPSMLSVLQVSVDAIRPDACVYYDPDALAGMSVKIRKSTEGQVGWQFFNHYAFPVGHQHGIPIRSELHDQARSRRVALSCIPQNSDIKTYYANEHLGHVSHEKVMTWNYGETQ